MITDTNFVSVVKESKRSAEVYYETLAALALLPESLKKRLSDNSVKIVIVPQVLDILPDAELAEYKEHAKSWPVLYEPPAKLIYIAERWDGYKGNSIKYNVINRCAFAYQLLSGIGRSPELNKAINADFDLVPGDVMPPNISDSGEFFSAVFAAVTISGTNGTDDWAKGFTTIYPHTTSFVRDTIDELRN